MIWTGLSDLKFAVTEIKLSVDDDATDFGDIDNASAEY